MKRASMPLSRADFLPDQSASMGMMIVDTFQETDQEVCMGNSLHTRSVSLSRAYVLSLPKILN